MKLDIVQKRILKIVALVIATGAIYTMWIYAFGRGMPCYFREFTGLQCPGCGSSRMFLALFRGDIPAAIHYNTVAFFAFPSWALITVLAFIGRPTCFRSSKVLLAILYVTIACYLIFGIVRNLI